MGVFNVVRTPAHAVSLLVVVFVLIDRPELSEVEATVHIGHTAAVYESINAVAIVEGLAN